MWINSNISTAAFSRRWTIFNPYLLRNKLRFSWNDLLWVKEHWLMSKLRFDSQSLESLGSVPPRRPIPAVVLHSSENLEESSGDCWDHETGGDWWGNYVEIKYKWSQNRKEYCLVYGSGSSETDSIWTPGFSKPVCVSGVHWSISAGHKPLQSRQSCSKKTSRLLHANESHLFNLSIFYQWQSQVGELWISR